MIDHTFEFQWHRQKVIPLYIYVFETQGKVHSNPNIVLNFRKSYQILGKLAEEQESCRQKTNWGVENIPPPVFIGLKHVREEE